LVLVDVADHGLNRLNLGRGLLGGLLRYGCFIASVDSVLIGLIGLVGSQLDASLRARIGVFNRLAVGSGQVIEFVDAIADRLGLALHILLAGERIDPSPEAFTAGWCEWRFARGGVG